MLLTKYHLLSACCDYFDDGQYVATYDGGPCSLIFANGKEFSFSLWSEELVEDRIFPKGTANIACIINFNYQIVSDEESADLITSGVDGMTYYKSGKTTISAHSETPLGNNSKWMIACKKKKYDVLYNENFFTSLAKIYEKDDLIGSVSTTNFPLPKKRSRFVQDIPLLERVFITLLASPWFHGRS